ncbi:SHOCT domain-containing protein [Mangrovimonas cancribranchiae]|uniref:SHOCT domain-containing protein n=1 Tax=Mangrovimonas cancribranchiae TaxID=3080055 RepID=A0AAU6NX63_9FLAO
MRLIIILTTTLFLNINSFSQTKKLDSYTASDGINYKIGDEVYLAGSDVDEVYESVISGGFGGWYYGRQNLKKTSQTRVFIIDKIKVKSDMFNGNPYLVGHLSTHQKTLVYNIDIEEAIKLKEIFYGELTLEVNEDEETQNELKSQNEPTSNFNKKYDKLKKLKELYDDGILTDEEFKKEKYKVLNE